MGSRSSDTDKTDVAKREEQILAYWKANNIFEKTLKKDSPEGEFVFYEGPPTANGKPAIHHLESRVFKDAIPRFKTMQGFHVPRKGGWDTHGLPVELEVEKDLDITTKGEIEKFGIDKFNAKCKESVWKYIDEWEQFTNRMGYWLDLDDPYVTYKPDYMESVWNRFAQADKRDLVYKDYKVVPWCPRCETALSSHELAQGYEQVKDLAVTAKFELIDPPEEIAGETETYMLAWTTTPWTLPANLALAAGEDITYVRVTTDEDAGSFILAKDRLEEVVVAADKEYEIEDEFSGEKLVGLTYKPVYPYAKEKLKADEFAETRDNAFKIYAADFVTTKEGTGIVHTAVMYGQDDFKLGEAVNLPRLHLVDQTGHFKGGTDFLTDRFVHNEDVAVDIIKDLYHRDRAGETGLLFDKGKFEHEYPHCWRCDTPLVYYARNSWYIAMTELREDLLEANEEINWEPEHIKHGRFGEWLDGVQDWAISRERFWGTPLPIWETEDGEDWQVIDSIESLRRKTDDSISKFILLRHGESEKNVKGVTDSTLDKHPLTEKGEKQAKETAEELERENIDVIYSSPVRRARETAEIIADTLEKEVKIEDGLREVDSGEWEQMTYEERLERKDAREYRDMDYEDYYHATRGKTGQSWAEYSEQIASTLSNCIENNKGDTVLLVGHQPLIAYGAKFLRDLTPREAGEVFDSNDAKANPVHYYVDVEQKRELDLHRPYIDDITWQENGKTYTRVPEVMDCWFDSGSMPWAQHHYPFENKDYVEDTAYPADFIAEAIDQTRGWFYTLHAIGVFSEMGRAYKNVISLGLIRDEDGNKMSKSVGNVVDPWTQMGKFGVDAIRFWMYSINQPGEDKDYAEETVDEIQKKVFNLARNVNRFYQMYGGDELTEDDLVDPYESPNVLDRWILLKLNNLVETATERMNDYDLLTPTRSIREFVGDLSRWYLRRSRDRFKADSGEDKQFAFATTQHVLETLAKLMAPFTPFFAEELYQEVAVGKDEAAAMQPAFADSTYAGSVHLTDWPETQSANVSADQDLLATMELVRGAASKARDLRSQKGLKVRQPLSTFYIGETDSPLTDNQNLLEILKDEVNVREIVFTDEVDGFKLDTEITDDLARAGAVREVIRHIQKLRKQAELDPQNKVDINIDASGDGRELITDNKEQITGTANLASVSFVELSGESELETHDFSFQFSLDV